jgi:hypothetical protein
MRTFSACLALVVLSSATAGEPDDRVKKQLKGESYSVTWGNPPEYDTAAELEIGDGNGHGFTLGWIRFAPGKEGADVLSIQFDEGFHPYTSKWPPDRAPVTVKLARMKTDAYAELLRDIAAVDAATLKPARVKESWSSSNSFWVNARLATKGNALVELNWAGYEGTSTQREFAKPQAVVNLARDATKGLDFKDHKLTDQERAWASAKFARDWKRMKDLDFYWWVRERYIQTIGVVGDQAALPVLRDILAADPGKTEQWEKHNVYHAINAVTRLTKTDVREKPVEEMDIEKTRFKILELLKEKK